MATLIYDGEEYETESGTTYYRQGDETDAERELVIKVALDTENVTQELIDAIHSSHGSKRGFGARLNGIEYWAGVTKTTVQNEEARDPQTGAEQGLLTVALIAPAESVDILLEK